MIYRLRVILDTQEDVFRDLEIEQDAPLEDLHNAIIQSLDLTAKKWLPFTPAMMNGIKTKKLFYSE